MADPSLQKYFGKETSDNQVFDVFINSKLTDSLSEEMFLEDEKIVVSDTVKNMWKIPISEAGKPPLGLTLPVLSNTSALSVDKISEAVLKNCPEEVAKRKVLSENDVTQDDRGLRELIQVGCFRSAVALTTRLLAVYDKQFMSVHSLQLYFVRLSLLVKLQEFELAKFEATPFGQLENPDVFFDFNSQVNKKSGSIASFSFRLLLAELPIHLDAPKVALENLIDMLDITRKIKGFYADQGKETEAEFWKLREIKVLSSLINCSVHLKNFDLTYQLFENLLQLPNLTDEYRHGLMSTNGRIKLKCGDIANAEKMFTEARKLNQNKKLDVIDFIDRGLVTIAQNDYQEAYSYFQKALELEPENAMIYNNMAVCFLYTGKLHEAIKAYEKAMSIDPSKTLNENILLNLSTLYELESNDSKVKKIELLKLINLHRADLTISLDLCLKL